MQIMMRVSLALMLVCGLPATALGASTLTGLEVSQGSTGELEVDIRCLVDRSIIEAFIMGGECRFQTSRAWIGAWIGAYSTDSNISTL